MEVHLLAIISLFTLTVTEVSPLRCYQCGPTRSSLKKASICDMTNNTEQLIADCPLSTMCVKEVSSIRLPNGEVITSVTRDCAMQTNLIPKLDATGHWVFVKVVQEAYEEGCKELEDKGQTLGSTNYCHCRGDLCNSQGGNHEGYTDIMGVIVVFNLMKYINSLR